MVLVERLAAACRRRDLVLLETDSFG